MTSGYFIEDEWHEFRVRCDQTIERAFCVARLDIEERKIVELKECGGFSLREIAYEMGYKNHESIRTRLKKINEKLDILKSLIDKQENRRGLEQTDKDEPKMRGAA